MSDQFSLIKNSTSNHLGTSSRSSTALISLKALDITHWRESGKKGNIKKILSDVKGSSSLDIYSGWLRKLGGKFKIWKNRYYVLTNQKLCYYTNAERNKLLGEFSLKNATILVETDIESNTDIKNYSFVIRYESGKNNASPLPPVTLAAPSQEERKLWVRAIRKVLYQKYGGAVFGTPLEEVAIYADPETGYIPRVVQDTTKFIRAYGMETEGIFRKCGTYHAIQHLADAYDVGTPGPILNPEEHDNHLVAGLLKYYLHELPEPLIPQAQYEKLKANGNQINTGADLQLITQMIKSLPIPNYNMLQYLCQFLHEVSQHETSNRMSIKNLASIFAPHFLRQSDEDLTIEISVSSLNSLIVGELIRCHDKIFIPESKPLNLASKSNTNQELKSVQIASQGMNNGINLKVQPILECRNLQHQSASPPSSLDNNNNLESRQIKKNGIRLNTPKHGNNGESGESGRSDSTSLLFLLDDKETDAGSKRREHKSKVDSIPQSASSKQKTHKNERTESSKNTLYSRKLENRIRNPHRASSIHFNPGSNSLNFPVQNLHSLCHKDAEAVPSTWAHRNPRSSWDKLSIEKVVSSLTHPVELTYPLNNQLNSTNKSLLKSAMPDQLEFPERNLSPINNFQSFKKNEKQLPDSETEANLLALIDQVRYWRAVAATAQANAAGHMTRAKNLSDELARVRCDLNMTQMEINLLRKRLASVESELENVKPNYLRNVHREPIYEGLDLDQFATVTVRPEGYVQSYRTNNLPNGMLNNFK